jgi:shikimate kinase
MSRGPVPKAIILRGPPGVGKSAVRKLLQRRLGEWVRHIDLDAYWGKDEWRYSQAAFRYADLQLAPEPILVVEFAWGEPAGLAFPGATRGANEWMGLLRNAGREIYPFYLTAQWGDILNRLNERHGREGHHDVLAELGRASFHEHKHYLFSYPEGLGITEHTIDTTGKDADSVAEVVMRVAGV